MKVTEACYKHQCSLNQSANVCIPNMIKSACRHSCVLLICFPQECVHGRMHAHARDFNFGKHWKVSLNRKMPPSTGQSLNSLNCLAFSCYREKHLQNLNLYDARRDAKSLVLNWLSQHQYSHKIILTVLVILLHCRLYSLCPPPVCLV